MSLPLACCSGEADVVAGGLLVAYCSCEVCTAAGVRLACGVLLWHVHPAMATRCYSGGTLLFCGLL